MLLYIDQPTLGVLNFGFIKYVCFSEPELYLRNALYTFPASGHKNISKKSKSFVSLLYVPPPPNSLPSQLLFISWETSISQKSRLGKLYNKNQITEFLSYFYTRTGQSVSPLSLYHALHRRCLLTGKALLMYTWLEKRSFTEYCSELVDTKTLVIET